MDSTGYSERAIADSHQGPPLFALYADAKARRQRSAARNYGARRAGEGADGNNALSGYPKVKIAPGAEIGMTKIRMLSAAKSRSIGNESSPNDETRMVAIRHSVILI